MGDRDSRQRSPIYAASIALATTDDNSPSTAQDKTGNLLQLQLDSGPWQGSNSLHARIPSELRNQASKDKINPTHDGEHIHSTPGAEVFTRKPADHFDNAMVSQ